MTDHLPLPDSISTIPGALSYWANRTPTATALRTTDDHALSYRELEAAIDRIAQQLTARGVTRQHRVALVLPTGFDLCLILLGTIATAAAIPLDPNASVSELTRDLGRSQPDLVIADGPRRDVALEIAAGLGLPAIGPETLLAPAGPESPPRTGSPPVAPEDIAVILHTSGTTALPKRVPRTHGNILAAVHMARAAIRLTPADVLLLTASVHHNLGMADLLVALLTGGGAVITPGFDPLAYPGWLRDERPTWSVLTPSELHLLLDETAAAGPDAIAGPESRLRAVLAEAQALPAATLARAETALRAPVLAGYGMTETGNVAKAGLDPGDRRPGSCGRSWGMAIRIIDDDGRDVAPRVRGEIIVRGPAVFSGYLDDPAANTAAFLADGWFRTGDTGYLDNDGFLYLTGRRGEWINRGGEKIAPAEIDDVLARHPAVAAAAVFPVPDPRLGEDLAAAVVLAPGSTATPREVRRWLLGQLSPAKVPRRIWFVSELPRTATGKVQRRILAERFHEETRRHGDNT